MSSQRGFTLVELMIALTLGLLLVLGLSQVFIASKQGYRVQESSGRMQESVRFALEAIGREIRHADFWGGIEPSQIVDGLPASTSAPCNTRWHGNFARGIEGFEGAASSPVSGCTVESYIPNSDVLAVRYADPNKLPTAAIIAETDNAARLFFRSLVGRTGQAFLGGDLSAAVTAVPELEGAFNYRYRSVVLSLGIPTTGPQIPTLYICDSQRRCGMTTGSNPDPLVEGVEQMQFEYGLDGNNDGIADRFSPASSITTTQGWAQVAAVRVGIILRGDEIDDFSDTTTYSLPGGASYTPAAAVQKFQRRVLVKDFQVRNRSRS